MNAVAYLRVSTEEQRLGPEAQRAAIEVWAKANAVTIVSWHLDQGLSGGLEIDYRPGLAEAIGAIKAHRATLLVVAKRDRLARDVYIAATIDRAVSRHGARIVSAGGEANGDTPADAFMRSILDGAAAYERAMIRGRTKAALAAKKARGERVGCVPFGYRSVGGKLEPHDGEQAVIAAVFEARARGLSVRGIVRELEASGARSRAGKPFAFTQVRRMLALATVGKEEAA
jgi:DNA invertase Pin-like site-specific DNA recombinase